jgi:hypothetical protein
VVGALEGDEAGLAGEERGGLDRGGDRVAAALTEDHPRAQARMERREALEQGDLHVGGVDIAEAEQEAVGLPSSERSTVDGEWPSSRAPKPAIRST